jgi:hypothetical protein
MAESVEEDPNTAYKRRQFNEPWDFIVSGIKRDGTRGLELKHGEFEEWLRQNYRLLEFVFRGPEESSIPHHSFVIATELNPLGMDVQGTLYTLDGHLELEPVTPLFVVRFLKAFQRRFPENKNIFSIIHTLTYARFDPSLHEEEAMLKMLSDDRELMEQLGVYFGETLQPE